MRASIADLVTLQGGHASTPAMALGEVGRLRGGGGEDGSTRKGRRQEFLRAGAGGKKPSPPRLLL